MQWLQRRRKINTVVVIGASCAIGTVNPWKSHGIGCPVKLCKPESKGERAESVFSDWAIHAPCCLSINVGGKAYSDGWLLVHSREQVWSRLC